MSFKAFMSRFHSNLALFILRVCLGAFMLLAHGLPKINNFPSASFPDPLGLGSTISMSLAIFAEAMCSLLLILGLWTRYAVIPLIFTMLVAVLIVHAGDPFGKKELGLMYLLGYIVVFLAGPGSYSVDQRLSRH